MVQNTLCGLPSLEESQCGVGFSLPETLNALTEHLLRNTKPTSVGPAICPSLVGSRFPLPSSGCVRLGAWGGVFF